VLVLGGFPQRGRHWHGGLLGAGYGVLLGTGFLASPVPRAMGVGHIGTQFGARFAVTVYLAHIGFGALMGWLTHRFGKRLDPIWIPALELVRIALRRAPRPGVPDAATVAAGHRPSP
jgi:hypothetical protein